MCKQTAYHFREMQICQQFNFWTVIFGFNSFLGAMLLILNTDTELQMRQPHLHDELKNLHSNKNWAIK